MAAKPHNMTAGEAAGGPRPDVRMTWANLLFLHWRVAEAVIRERIPDGLEVDTFDGSAWIAVVPFRMEETRFRGVPDVGGLGDFYECNVRTYVREPAVGGDGGRRGVWFFSLDAEHLLPVLGGRWLWSLNYIYSRFRVEREGDRTDYQLVSRLAPGRRAHIVWRQGEALPPSRPGSLEEFLTERYWLFTQRRGRIRAGRVDHVRWPLRTAAVERVAQTLTDAAGVAVSGAPLAWCTDRIEVLGWKLGSPGPGAVEGSLAEVGV